MIIVDKEVKLTYKNLLSWIKLWEEDKPRIKKLDEMYKNKKGQNEALVKLPFAKKLVLISSSAAVGEGVTISCSLEGAQLETFNEIKRLFEGQTIISQDRKVIKAASTYGRGYELAYLSSDAVPVPKVAAVSALNAFVVFDNTVEHNSMFGVRFERYFDGNKKRLSVEIYDNKFIYVDDIEETNAFAWKEIEILPSREHFLGRVPLTEFKNNDEEQGDFEQVVPLILDRSKIHDKNLKDFDAIAKNYLKARNVELAGVTDKDKSISQEKMAEQQRIEFETDGVDATDDINILSKNENYQSVTEFGADMDSKIYDLSLIPNLADEKFAGNQSGVALELKLMPFKYLIADKDEEIEKLYRRRIKMYMTALMHKGEFEPFDISNINIQINRNWSKVLTEIAAIIAQLYPTGLYSEKFLTNLMPKADYDAEITQKEVEEDKKRQRKDKYPDPNNQSAEWLASIFNKE